MKNIHNILVLASEALVVDMITRHLKRKGILLSRAANEAEAQELIEQARNGGSPYDLVIADLFAPRIDGVSFFRWLTNNHSKLPMLVLCGYGTVDLTLRFLRPGRDGYCRKPLNPAALWEAVQKILDVEQPEHPVSAVEVR